MAEPLPELRHDSDPRSDDAIVSHATSVLEMEAQAIRSLVPRLGASFASAVRKVVACRGRVVVTGMGKAGFIAQKLSATLASTGTPSHFLHPAEALHGDLGRVASDDVVIALSNSGESDELVALFPAFERLGVPLIAITGGSRSSLARAADDVLDIGPVDEACPMGLAPTASAAALLAMGDALAMAVLRIRPFTQEDYAHLHPAGKLGRRLRKVSEVMRRGLRNPLVHEASSVSDALAVMTRTPGRPGATSVVDDNGRLVGVFTDGDLRRLVQSGNTQLTSPVADVMTQNPRTVDADMLAVDAIEVLRAKQIDQVPVVDENRKPIGLLDVQDLLVELRDAGAEHGSGDDDAV